MYDTKVTKFPQLPNWGCMEAPSPLKEYIPHGRRPVWAKTVKLSTNFPSRAPLPAERHFDTQLTPLVRPLLYGVWWPWKHASCNFFPHYLVNHTGMATVDQGLPGPIMNGDAEDQQIALQEFRDMAELYLEVRGIEREVMWNHIILLLGRKGMTRQKASGLMEAKRRELKTVCEKFSSSIQSSNIFRSTLKFIPHFINTRMKW